MLALIALLGSSAALAWPADAEWAPLLAGGAPMEDVGGDHGLPDDYLDLSGDAAHPAGLWFADASHVYFRVQVTDDPQRTATELQPVTWGVVLDTGGDADDLEVILVSNGTAGQLEVYTGDGTAGIHPGAAALTYEGSYGDLASGEVRVQRGSGAWYHVDLSVSRADWAAITGLADADAFRALPVAGVSPWVVWDDVANCDSGATVCADLEVLLADEVTVDADEDGWTDPEEAVYGSDPADADSDDDGLVDGLESTEDVDSDGLMGFEDCDSDDDGVLDGTEAGVTAAHGDTDTGAGCFVADADAGSTTDPNDRDTDDGGLLDGEEDWNGSGAIDCWETDPTDPDDDPDTDGDGIPDFLEGGWDEDSDGKDNEVDLDSDGDGLSDAEEWPYDTDGDCVPDFLEDDSDGDGIDDRTEGLDDVDGDGIPNARDDDSDGDGTPDSDEGVDDSDCDGIPDYLDDTDDEGLCDTGTPTLDTGGWEDDDTGDGLAWLGGDFTGGACSTSPLGALVIPALVGGLVLAGRRRRGAVVALALAALVLPSVATAQDVDGQRLRPSPEGRSFVKLADNATYASGAWGGSLWLNWADDPLVFRYRDDTTEELEVLGAVVSANAVGFYSLGKARVGVDLPVHLYTSGFGVEGPTHLGDVRLIGRYAIQDAGTMQLGAYLELLAPTGHGPSRVGAGRAGARLGVIDTFEAGPVAVALNLGVSTGTGQSLGDLDVGPGLDWGAGAAYPVTDTLLAALEVDGSFLLGNQGQPGAWPVEALLSGRYAVTGDLLATVGVGTGITRGLGAPDVRLVAGFGWAPRPEVTEAVVEVAPPPPPPEPAPAAPALGDLVVRAVGPTGKPVQGASVRVLGTLGQSMKAGPDGILEATLPAGPYEIVVTAEGWSTDERALEIPEGERIDVMVVLRPDEVTIDEEAGEIYLTDKIFFALDKAELKVESVQTLDLLVGTLLGHPDLRVRVEGHTDSQGRAEYNMDLSHARATAVVDYLVSQGVVAARLEARGYGETRLLQEGESDEVHATNRRVEFHLLEPVSE